MRRISTVAYQVKLLENAQAAAIAEFEYTDLDRLSMDMRPIEDGKVRLSYANRHVLFEIEGKLWARAYDTLFMRLHHMAVEGHGENLDAGRDESQP